MQHSGNPYKLNKFVFSQPDIYKGHTAIDQEGQDHKKGQPILSAQLDALANMKFTYVISCQKFGKQKANGDPRAQDIIDLMTRYFIL